MPSPINLPAILPTEAKPAPPRTPLVPERSDFLDGDAPAAAKVEAFLARALESHGDGSATAGALVPWICDALLSNHSVRGSDSNGEKKRSSTGLMFSRLTE